MSIRCDQDLNVFRTITMDKSESLEEFYKKKFNWMSESISNEIGHFNLFRLEPLVPGKLISIPYRRRGFYKVMLVKGNSKVHFADKVVEVKKQALSFSNPLIPYKWEHLDNERSGIFCIFNQHFFHEFDNLTQYEVFQSDGTHIFELSDDQANAVSEIFERMMKEFHSDYKYKYDLVRNLIFELLHFGLKMQPAESLEKQQINASQRIFTLFLELLERQFPIDDTHPKISFRTPAEFADQLNVHVNHLNRAIKETVNKTTSHNFFDQAIS